MYCCIKDIIGVPQEPFLLQSIIIPENVGLPIYPTATLQAAVQAIATGNFFLLGGRWESFPIVYCTSPARVLRTMNHWVICLFRVFKNDIKVIRSR